MLNNKLFIVAYRLLAKECCLLLAILATLISLPAFAAPIAVDDNVAVPSNTTVFANDLAANDTTLATDTYTITVPPTNGTATLTTDGLLDYTPNIGFASIDTLTYSVDDGAGGVDGCRLNRRRIQARGRLVIDGVRGCDQGGRALLRIKRIEDQAV